MTICVFTKDPQYLSVFNRSVPMTGKLQKDP